MFLLKFLHVLSWIMLPISILMVILINSARRKYDAPKSLQKAFDQFKGIKRTFPYKFWPHILIFSIVFLITYYTR